MPDLTYSAPLKANDTAVINVQIALLARAKGSGSYAEINFADGQANGIGPALLLGRTW